MNLLLRSPSQIVNPLDSRRRFGFGSGVSGAEAFIGPLDAYASGLAGAWSVSRRLLSSYPASSPLVRIRRSSDNAELDVGSTSTGALDTAALSSFVGGGNWFLRWAYNQQGTSGRDIGQSSASAQPQGAIDGGGIPYVFAPNAGFTGSGMTTGALSIATTSATQWSVGSSSAFNFDTMTIRFASGTERRISNYSNALIAQMITAGTMAQISSTNTGRYSVILQSKTTGSRISNRLTSATGTKFADAQNISTMMIGQGGGGNFWSQNSAWFAAAVWVDDIGDSSADALNTTSQTLFNVQ